MKRAKRPVVASALAISMAFGAMSPVAAQASQMDDIDGNRPGEIAMIADTVLVRPLMLGATIVGTAVYRFPCLLRFWEKMKTKLPKCW